MNQQETLELQAQYRRAIFDLIPSPAIVVDSDVRIHDFNTAAEILLGTESSKALSCLYGDAFHCLNAEAGCGQSSHCSECVIRRSVRRALEGAEVHRDYCTVETKSDRQPDSTDWLVTAGLLPYANPPRVLVVLENVTELVNLHSWKKTHLVEE
jgi:PAS domain-containing protein